MNSDTPSQRTERIQFTCKDCGKEVDRPRRDIDVPGLPPVRCGSCTLERMAE